MVRITPEMRNSVLGGMPLFARDDPRVQQIHDALSQIASGADRAVLKGLRPDLAQFGGDADVWLTWGGINAGLQKILTRRGPQVLGKVLRTVTDGTIQRYVPATKRVMLELGDGRAMLSLDDAGEKRTWLLTGWQEGKPDASGEVRAAAGATQARPTFSRSDLGAGLDDILRSLSDDANPDPNRPMFARAADEMDTTEPEDKRTFLGRPGLAGKAYDIARKTAMFPFTNQLAMDIRKVLNPRSLSDMSKLAANRIVPFLADLARQKEIALANLEQYSREVDKLSYKQQLQAYHEAEIGERQSLPQMPPIMDALQRQKVRVGYREVA